MQKKQSAAAKWHDETLTLKLVREGMMREVIRHAVSAKSSWAEWMTVTGKATSYAGFMNWRRLA